jgi:hypothetical protein
MKRAPLRRGRELRARDDLRLARYLQRALLGEQLVLADEKREQLDLLPVQRIMHVT